MLGIVFTGGKGPSAQRVRSLVEEQAKGALSAAADSGLDAAEAAGFEPNWIIGDMDSLSDAAKLDAYPEEKIMLYPTEKDHTDTELAFSLLQKKGCDTIWIIGGGGGRPDHLLAIRSLMEREVFPSRWITDAADIYCIEAASPTTNEINLNFAVNTIVSVFPLGDSPWEAKSRGLKWPLDNVTWNRGFISLSNVAEMGSFSVTAIKGRFMALIPNMEKE